MLQLVRGASRTFPLLGFGCWFAYWVLLSFWMSGRPRKPTPPFVFRFEDKGTIYVSSSDLHLSHILLGSIAVSVVMAIAAVQLERLWPEGRRLHEERKAKEWAAWIARNNARIQRRTQREGE